MNIEQIAINKVKPDPNQPRRYFDPIKIKELALNISKVGIINPIEIDEHNVIITGGSRFEAAKIAKLEKIPVKVLSGLLPKDRFKRQLMENLYNDTMHIEDTGAALTTYFKLFSSDKHANMTEWLAKDLGKSKDWIQDKLEIYRAPKEVKEALKIKGGSYVRATLGMNSEAKQRMATKIKNEFVNRHIAEFVGTAVRNNPDRYKDILNLDFKQVKNTEQAKAKISSVVPEYTETPITDALEKSTIAPNEIGKAVQNLLITLNTFSKQDIKRSHQYRVALALNTVLKKITNWMLEEKQLQLERKYDR